MQSNQRPVRSFVMRASRVTNGQRNAIDSLWSRYGIDEAHTQLDMTALFGRQAPTVLEIGFGMGTSLVEMAQNDPDTNFIGIEVYPSGIGSVLRQLNEHHVDNVRVLNTDAVEILQQRIPDHSLSGVNLFFPDPWHKTRHHKRRIVQAEFVRLLHQKLVTGGQFHMATDWEDYAHWMMEITSASGLFENSAGNRAFTPRPEFRPVTKFEKRGLKLGHGVWDLIFRAIRE